jgi:hypothetical protein
MSRILQRLGSTRHVLFRGATERGNFDFLALGGDSPDGGKVTFRSDRKAGFDDVDPRSWSLLAIRTFSVRFIEQPGDCSPSRKVVSKMLTLFCGMGFPPVGKQ